MKSVLSPVFLLSVFYMGFLNDLFQKIGHKEPAPVSQKQDWEFYSSNVNGKLSSLFVDLGLYKIAPMADKPNLVWIVLQMNNPYENGLSSQQESEMLYTVETVLIDELAAKYHSIFAGRLTSDGQRTMYLYFGDTTSYTRTIADAMAVFPQYRYDLGTKADAKWDTYFDFLYPSPREMQSIQNRRVIAELEKNGDGLTKKREVCHWIYFKSDQDRTTYLNKIAGEHFTVVIEDHDKSRGTYPYLLVIKRIDKVDRNSVDEYTIHLWELANETKGDYDGWETSVEK